QAAGNYENLLPLDYLGPNVKLNVLMSLGRVYTAAGRPDDAVRKYEQLIREYPQQLQAFMANAKLAELKGAPLAFPLPPDDFPVAAAPNPAEEAATGAE
ncbi:MAG: tetratricopeptide repeat protein, partial [Candidatus Adiutrix sp.]|nr:tetratricopeptide repeat protein [Candidatus Adiutrix sp.]